MPEIISRKEAIARGLKRYFTGKACLKDHIAERRTHNSECMRCIEIYAANKYAEHRAERRAAQQEYYRSHREERLEWARRHGPEYRKNNKVKIAVAAKERRTKNSEYRKKYAAEYRKQNLAKINEKRKEQYWRNPEKWRAYTKKWMKENADKYRDYRLNGPKNPKDEMQWLRKSQALLRNLKKTLRPRRRAASTSSQTET